MTPRCSQCRWLLADGETHGTLECYVRTTARVLASRVSTQVPSGVEALPTKRGVDVREPRRTLRDVVAVGRAS
jgi:hypothetical protein